MSGPTLDCSGCFKEERYCEIAAGTHRPDHNRTDVQILSGSRAINFPFSFHHRYLYLQQNYSPCHWRQESQKIPLMPVFSAPPQLTSRI